MLKVLSKKIVLTCAASLIAGSLLTPNSCYADSIARQASRDFIAVAKKSIPAVVYIKIKAQSKKQSYFDQDGNDLQDFFNNEFFHRFFQGRGMESKVQPVEGQASGFIVSKDGYILTNSHVVKDATEITVRLNDGKEYSAKVIGSDSNTEIAVIKIDASNLPYVELGDSDNLEVGEWVVAIGNPYGLQASLTVGVVSAKGRNNLDLADTEDFIQTDASINRGNSGGPLLNLDSEVVGMNTAIVTNMGMGSLGIGFAIPSNMMKKIMDQIIKTGSVSRGFMGVTLQALDRDLAQAFNVDQNEGALVADISKDSPAEKAGIKQGDIIKLFNGHSVTNIAALRTEIALTAPGTSVKLSVLRDGKIMQIPVQIGTYPASTKPQAAEVSGNELGFEVQDLSSETARALGITEGEGVVISKVAPNSPAATAGLKKGAMVLAVNQKKVDNVSEFNAILKATPKDKPILLLIKQGETIRFLSLKVG
jgi:serine protease Do